MNLLIETLNVWADQALRFAWPMLWQSSLLIGLLFALDLVMRRRLRPAVRYALWLVVLVKLLVPPSLAFPTGPGWWLRTAKAAPARLRPATVVVTYGPADTPLLTAPAMPVFVAPPRPRLTQAAWALLGTVTVSLGLLAWMLARWHQVARDARRAAVAPARLSELLPEPRRPVRLRLTDQPQSPAVCGLFRPVILLPRSLVEQLAPAQLRAVLLHEMLHLCRGDVWVNCAQALLQIAYWWHPLLWFANARIRRVREEAVDDAVMVALNDDAEAYAPTLLEVAKLALRRPLASLGLVGILESRSSLRQRIERLMDFRPPRKAGLTLGSALTVLGFAALAVPMGEAPAPTETAPSSGTPAITNSSPSNSSSGLSSLDQKIKAGTLTQDGKLLYEMGKLNEADAKLQQALKEDPHDASAFYYLNLVSEARFARASAAAPNPSSHTNLVQTSPARQAMLAKLDRIRLDSVSFDGQPLSEVVRILNAETRKRDPEKRGINFLINQSIDRGGAAATTAPVLGPDGNPLPAPSPERVDMGAIAIKINPPLTNIRLADVLDAIVKVADPPMKYSISDYAILFSLRGRETTPLYVRTFKVDPKTILQSLPITKHTEGTNGPGATVVAALRDYFESLGVELDPVRNPGKALFYKDRQGMFIVRATMQDLDIIEAAIQVLNSVPPQINIKCKFIEVPQDDPKTMDFDWYLGNVVMTNGAMVGQIGTATSFIGLATAANPSGAYPGNPSPIPSTLTGILTDPRYRVVVKALEQRSGAEIIAQPEVTTLSGRQAQMKTVNIQTVVTGVNYMALTLPGITTTNDDQGPLYVTKPMEFGPTLDVIPCVLADGYTISLTVIPTVTEFLGYEENPTNRVAVYVNGKKTWVTPPLPRFHQSQMATSVNVWDGQTVVLGGLESETVGTLKDKMPLLGDLPLLGKLFRSESKTTKKKKLLVFITPTLIDPAGNRLHTDRYKGRDAVLPRQGSGATATIIRFMALSDVMVTGLA
jgi:type II secretory pathway component GspD/PulD (secretin)/beta-lactamase regulating signal transducer with metallopeptidase domain